MLALISTENSVMRNSQPYSCLCWEFYIGGRGFWWSTNEVMSQSFSTGGAGSGSPRRYRGIGSPEIAQMEIDSGPSAVRCCGSSCTARQHAIRSRKTRILESIYSLYYNMLHIMMAPFSRLAPISFCDMMMASDTLTSSLSFTHSAMMVMPSTRAHSPMMQSQDMMLPLTQAPLFTLVFRKIVLFLTRAPLKQKLKYLANDAARADHNVGADFGSRVDCRGLIHQHVAFKGLSFSLELIVLEIALLPDEIVLGLADIMPEVVLLQVDGVQLAFLGHLREYFLFDHAEPLRDSVNHLAAEQVDPRVDLITDEVLGLLDETLNAAFGVGDDDPETARILDGRQDDGSLLLMGLVEVDELLERVVADDVAVKDEEQPVIAALLDDGFGEFDGAGRTQGLLLLRADDLDLVLGLDVLELRLDLVGLVVDGQDHLCAAHLCQRLSYPQQVPRFGARPSGCSRRGLLIWGRRTSKDAAEFHSLQPISKLSFVLKLNHVYRSTELINYCTFRALFNRLFMTIRFFLVLLFLAVALASAEDDLVKKPLVEGYGPYPYYSGYLNISLYKALHYVLFTSQHDSDNDPVLLWLNGGPGCSSMLGMLYENGPFKFDRNTTDLRLNNHSWNAKANLLYIETPGSVGFSIGPDDNSDESTAEDNLQAMSAFYAKFPQFRKNQLYLSGESYAGVYVPWLALKIHEYNQRQSALAIPFKGFILGNGCTDPEECYVPGSDGTSLFQYEFLYQHGYYTQKQYEHIRAACVLGFGSTECFEIRSLMDAKFANTSTWINNIYLPCLFQSPLEGQTHVSLQSGRRKKIVGGSSCGDSKGAYEKLNDPFIRELLNVGGFPYTKKWSQCSLQVQIKYQMDPRASYWIYPKLIEAGYRLWVYSGDVDANVPITGTITWVQRLREQFSLPVLEPWREWWLPGLHKYEDQVGGMFWKVKGLTFVSVKNAGHLVPTDQPASAQFMVNKYLEGNDLPDKLTQY